VIKFSIVTNTIGTESRWRIRTDTSADKKVMEYEARGSQQLRPGCQLDGLGRSTTYDQIMTHSSKSQRPSSRLGHRHVKESLQCCSQTIRSGPTRPERQRSTVSPRLRHGRHELDGGVSICLPSPNQGASAPRRPPASR